MLVRYCETMSAETDESTRLVARTLEAVAEYKHRGMNRRNWLLPATCAASGVLIAIVIDWFAAWQFPVARWADGSMQTES